MVSLAPVVGFLYRLARPLLFRFDPERIHGITIRFLNWAGRWWYLLLGIPPRTRPTGRALFAESPVGAAAGLIKVPRHAWAAPILGFSFVEIGTLTRLPQVGNPKPRLYRLPKDRALINRMGFNNDGFHHAIRAMRRLYDYPIPIGVNLGKGKRTPPDQLEAELAEGIFHFTRFADFFVVNLSSPNTSGLRQLLDPTFLDGVLPNLRRIRDCAARFWSRAPAPLLLKLHDDLDETARREILDWLPEAPIDGVVAINTTIDRGGLRTPAAEIAAMGDGGMSGAPLAARRDEMLTAVRRAIGESRILIGAGGVDGAAAARTVRDTGADAVEIYTGLIFGGPAVVERAKRGWITR